MNSEVLTDISLKMNRRIEAAIYGLCLIMYLPVIAELVETWSNDDNYSHGFIVPIVSIFVLYKKRDKLATINKQTTNIGLIPLICGLALFVIGNAGAEYFTVGVSLVITLFGITYYLYGKEFIRETWFAFFILLFMIPIPAVVYFSATFPMQLFASKVSVFLLDIIGIPVVRQGNMIHLPQQTLEVAEACSGLRSLISLLAMGAIYGYMAQEKLLAKSLLFFSTIPIAIGVNVIRVFMAALLTYAVEMDTTAEPLHTIIGLLMFLFSFILLFIFNAIISKLVKS